MRAKNTTQKVRRKDENIARDYNPIAQVMKNAVQVSVALLLTLAISSCLPGGSTFIHPKIYGYVTDSQSGAPIENALVQLNWNDVEYKKDTAYSNASGYYEIPEDIYVGWTVIGVGYGYIDFKVYATKENYALTWSDYISVTTDTIPRDPVQLDVSMIPNEATP